jgi:hypothetical protein
MDKNVNYKGKKKKSRKIKCDSASLRLKRVNKLIQIQNSINDHCILKRKQKTTNDSGDFFYQILKFNHT